MIRTKKVKPSEQVKRKVANGKASIPEEKEYEGDFSQVVSTGSTLLDLEISGRSIRGGGIPRGIMIEIFGPSGCGKTVLLCEIAGAVQRLSGDVLFKDPEARLVTSFARIFDLDTNKMGYTTPDTVTEVFKSIREWEPKNPTALNGVFTDSLAALSTDLEMEKEEGDKMGMRRAKEFSEGFRQEMLQQLILRGLSRSTIEKILDKVNQ